MVTYHFNLQFQKITTTMSVLRLKWFFVSLLDSRMIDSFFFLIGSTNCHSSHSFCFVFTELLHDSSSVTLLNKHFIKPRINCLFFWIRVLEHPMSGWVLFFVFQLATEALYRATNICSSLNLKPLFFFNCRFSPDFAIVLICCIFSLTYAKTYNFGFFVMHHKR